MHVTPQTLYAHNLIASLPKRGEWVFAGDGEAVPPLPAKNMKSACKVTGADHVPRHGLRYSLKSLAERLEISAGVVAQLMGHKPSATAEKHATVRPLGLLQVHHEKVDTWLFK